MMKLYRSLHDRSSKQPVTRLKNTGAVLLFSVLALCLPANAQILTEGDYTYSLINENQAVGIIYYSGSAADLVIPDTLGGKPVTYIGIEAFDNIRTTLQSVRFPASLIRIGECAFFGCSGLTQLTLPDSLTSIDASAFEACTGLTQLTLPDSLTSIGDFAFLRCIKLTQVTIPASVNFIGERAFRFCDKLQTALFEGHAPGTLHSTIFHNAAAGFKVQFYEGAGGFSTPAWREYSSESLSVIFPIWRTRFGFTEDDLTAANGEPLLLAYALNLDPTNSTVRVPAPVVESGAFRLDFPVSTIRSDALLQVERTSDLPAGNWQPAETVTNSDTASVSIPLTGSESPEKLYLRFTASEQTEE